MQLTNQESSKTNPLILFPSSDYCHRYRPHYDFTAFQQQLTATQSDLIDYMDSPISSQFHSYTNTTKAITFGFWGCSIGLAVFAHKIPFLVRVLGSNNWKLFTFKMSALLVPFLCVEQIMAEAEKQETKSLYQSSKPYYIRYKLTGDIFELGGKIQLVGEPLQEETKPSIIANETEEREKV